VVNAEDSRSESWFSDVSSNPGFTSKLDGKDGPIGNENNNDRQKGQVTSKKYFLNNNIILFVKPIPWKGHFIRRN